MIRFNSMFHHLLDFGDTRLVITEDKIHQVLGIPKTGIDILEVDDCEINNRKLKKWMDQSDLILKQQQVICDLIEEGTVADEMFDMNFLMLFVNTIVEKKSSGDLDTKVLMKLPNVKDKTKINWCKYLNETLIKSKKYWKPDKTNIYYSGPLAFLIEIGRAHV